MKKIFASIILLCMSILFPAAYIQADNIDSDISFTRFSLEDGLSQSTVLDILQDNYGSIWFATQDGLNKFDGYGFTVYHHNINDTTGIASDQIYSLDINSDNRLWIGTGKGLSCYNLKKERFSNYFVDVHENLENNSRITHVAIMDSSRILVLSAGQLLYFHTDSELFEKAKISGLANVGRYHSLTRQDSIIYIGTDSGLYSYSINSGNAQKFPFCELNGKPILTALFQAPSYMWVATEGYGLFRFDLSNGNSRQYTTKGKYRISSNLVRSLELDSKNRLWAGTFTALNIYRAEDGIFVPFTYAPSDPLSVSQTSIRSIFRDSQGGMWLGTYFGGVSYYNPHKKNFSNLHRMPEKNSLNDNVISCIKEDGNGNLWIGTNGGLNILDREKGIFEFYTVEDGLISNDIKAVHIDEKRQLAYVGGHAAGLAVIDIRRKKIVASTANNPLMNKLSIYTIYPKNEDELWVGTSDNLKCLDKRSMSFTECRISKDGIPIKLSDIHLFHKDSKKRVWISGKEGFYTLENDGLGFKTVEIIPVGHALEKEEVFCMYEQAEGRFWFGTRNGLYFLDENRGILRLYSRADGLPNNIVYGILEDSFRNLWLSTGNGLSFLIPDIMKFRNYTVADGLQSNQFTQYAYCRTRNGQMYFGGINGITVFYPEQLTDNPYAPPVRITGLRIFNNQIRPDDNTGIINECIENVRQITLNSKQSVFSIDFVVSNYVSGVHNTFAYKLEGYDRDWILTNSVRSVSYSNLPHGKYRFMVKAANNDGVWNDNPTTLDIEILPPWYRTWWARLIFSLVAIGIMTLVIRYFWTKKIMKARLEMEQKDKERQKEINEMKLRFFINISHELRTPLTMITAPLHDLLEKVDDKWILRQLGYIKHNTDRLLHLVNQLMDYRRAELGVFRLKVRPVEIDKVIEKNFLYYERLAKQKNIAYTFLSDLNGKEVVCDPEYMELIANNLISNAFKYTGHGGSISIILKEKDKELIFQVKDTGTGIPEDIQDRIFERFYQADSEHFGSGIGLSLVQRLVELHHGHVRLKSKEGEGCEFTVSLPTDISIYTEKELYMDTDNEKHTTNVPEMYMADVTDYDADDKTDDTPLLETEHNRQFKESLLIVEDNADIRKYLTEELGTTYNILQAGNGEEALALLKEQNIDMVLTDVMMPVMDGIQLCRLIKQNINTCHIPVIILSAKTNVKEQSEGLNVGADDYIPKPFVMNLLRTKIKNLFRTRYRVIEFYSKSPDQQQEVIPEKIALNPLDEKFLKNAKDIMERHMDDVNFTTDTFAREMLMSRSSLHLKMKALTGESTNEYIRKVRLYRACKLLKENRYTVAEISVMTGFNTPSYFSTSFKKFFGCMPSEYGK